MFEGPKVAKRKAVCKSCGAEIRRGEEYWVTETLDEISSWVGYDPGWGIAAWRHPTRTRMTLKRRIVCAQCKRREDEKREKRFREWEERDRRMLEEAERFVLETLREEREMELSRLVRVLDSFSERRGVPYHLVTDALLRLERERGVVERREVSDGSGRRILLRLKE